MEQRLGARLLHRSTRGVTLTEVGALYYEKCKLIAREVDEADNLATLLQSKVGGTLRISTSVRSDGVCSSRWCCATCASTRRSR